MSEEWRRDIFRELKGTGTVLPPEGGVPASLREFQRDNRIEQPVWRRKDYLTDTWCHLNLARASRPFTAPQLTRTEEQFCFFCPGNEHSTPRDVDTGGDTLSVGSPAWKVRAFPNLFPWLAGHGNIVESPHHKVSLKDLIVEEQFAALKMMKQICTAFEEANLYPMIFKNQGWGASTAHTHWQYGALPYVPKRLAHELATAGEFARKWNRNIFDAILTAERERGERFVSENDHVACIAPFAPRTNYEVWLIMKSSCPSLTSSGDEQLEALAVLLVELLQILFHGLNIDSLCVVCHQIRGQSDYRLHMEVLPYKHWAGAERGFEEYAVEVTPEQAAAFLRERVA